MQYIGIPANRPDFIGIVPIYNFQNGQKLGRPNFFLLIFFFFFFFFFYVPISEKKGGKSPQTLSGPSIH